MPDYSKAQNLGERIVNAVKFQQKYDSVYDWAKFFKNYYITVKEDGTQIHFDLLPAADGNIVIGHFRSHRGNKIVGKNTDGDEVDLFESAEQLMEIDVKFQKIPLNQRVAAVWSGFQQLFNYLNAKREIASVTIFMEGMMPGITPCKLDYDDDRKQRLVIFELVVNYRDDSGTVVNYPINRFWAELLTEWGLTPSQAVFQGTDMTFEIWCQILKWIKDRKGTEEGLMMISSINDLTGYRLESYSLTKLKLYHADDLLNNLEEAIVEEAAWTGQEMAYRCFRYYLEERLETRQVRGPKKPSREIDYAEVRRRKELAEEYQRILRIEIVKEWGHSEWKLAEQWSLVRDKPVKDKNKTIGKSGFYKAVIKSMNGHIPDFQKKLRGIGRSVMMIDEIIAHLENLEKVVE